MKALAWLATLSLLFLPVSPNNAGASALLSDTLRAMNACSPAAYDFVLQNTSVILFWNELYSYSLPGGITIVSIPMLQKSQLWAMQQIIHEARHNYQRSNPQYWPDYLRYYFDHSAQFRIELDAHTFAFDMTRNCH